MRLDHLLLSLLLIMPVALRAQTYTWSGGGGDDNFGTGANWGGSAPSTGSGVVLHFTGSTRPTPNNNYTTGDNFGEWRLASGAAADFTITGNGFGLYDKIEVDSGVGHSLTINTAGIYARDGSLEINPIGGNIFIGSGTSIELDGNTALNVYDGNNNHTLRIDGELSNGDGLGGDGSLVLNQTATVVLTNNNNNYGATTIHSGAKLRVGDLGASGVPGTGTITVDSGGTLEFARTDNSFTFGTPFTGSGTVRFLGTGSINQSFYEPTGNNSSFSGSVVVDKARLRLDSGNDVGSASSVTVNNGGQVAVFGGATINRPLALTGNGWTESAGTLGALRLGNSGVWSGAVTLSGNARVTTYSSTDTGTVSGVISGAHDLEKTGAGVLVLSGANTYSGKTTVSGGTLSISADTHLGAAPGSPVADQLKLSGSGTTLEVTAAVDIDANRGMTIAGGAGLNSSSIGSNRFNVNSKITGSGGLTLAANGNLTDSGGGDAGYMNLGNAGNDFTGTVRVTSGLVKFNGNGAFGNTGNVIELAGNSGLLSTTGGAGETLAASRSIVFPDAGSKIFRAYGSASLTVNGPVSGPSSGTATVRHTDGGTLTFNGVLSFAGNFENKGGTTIFTNPGNTYGATVPGSYTLIHKGTVKLGADNALPSHTIVVLYNDSTPTFDLDGHEVTVAGLASGSSIDTGAVVQLGSGGSVTVTGNQNASGIGNVGNTYYGRIRGSGNVTYANTSSHTGSWFLRNAGNDFTGTLTVQRGRLRIPSESVLGNSSNALVFDGDVVPTLGNGEGRASIQIASAGNLTLGSGRTIVLNSGKEGTMYVWGSTTMTINGKVTGGGNLRKEDGGTLLLTNTSNDYTGLTKIAMGQIRLGNDNVLPDATEVVIGNSGVLNLNGKADTVKGLSGNGENGGQISNGGVLTVNGSGSYTYEGKIITGATVSYAGTGSLTLAGNQDNGGGWAKVESGTLILAKASTGSVHAVGRTDGVGLWITGGTARLAGTGNDQIYADTHVEMTGGVLDMNDRNEGFRALKGSGGTVLNNGSGASTLTIGERSVSADSYTFGGTLADGTGTLNIEKVADGAQEFTGANTFTGNVNIKSGTIRVPTITTTGIPQPLGQGSAPIQLSGGILEITGAGSYTTNRGLQLVAASVGGTISIPSGTVTMSGEISGSTNTSDFSKAGAGTFNQTGMGSWIGNFYIQGGEYNVTGSGTIANSGITTLTNGATLNIDTTSHVRTTRMDATNSDIHLNAGTLRTNEILLTGSSVFTWGAATLAVRNPGENVNAGTTDRTGTGGPASGQPLFEGTILTINNGTGTLSTSADSILDLGPMYYSGGNRYDMLKVTGTLDLSAADDTLNIEINPYFLRPFGPNTVSTGDWGTFILAHAETITGQFNQITGIGTDSIGWTQLPTETDASIDPADLGLNEWVLEYRTDYGAMSGGDVLLLHYKVSGTVPEPASAGLIIGGVLLLRTLARRRK